MSLESDTSVAQMAYVDEAECIGCTYCASIARSTFHMQVSSTPTPNPTPKL